MFAVMALRLTLWHCVEGHGANRSTATPKIGPQHQAQRYNAKHIATAPNRAPRRPTERRSTKHNATGPNIAPQCLVWKVCTLYGILEAARNPFSCFVICLVVLYFVLSLKAGTEPVLLFDWRIDKGGRKVRNDREGVAREGGRDGRRVERRGAVLGAVALCLVLWQCVGRRGTFFGGVSLCLALWHCNRCCGVVFDIVALCSALWCCVWCSSPVLGAFALCWVLRRRVWRPGAVALVARGGETLLTRSRGGPGHRTLR